MTARQYICERLSFNQLYGMSEPKRVERSLDVKGPSLTIEAFHGGERYFFNFKSRENTEKRRHKGHITFFPPRGRNVPLQRLECEVDCSCKDYRYRWAWSNKQRGSGRVGNATFNGAWNRAPRITNPTNRPGLCKHLLALKRYIYGLYTQFQSELPNDEKYLQRLIRAANTQTISVPGGAPVPQSGQTETPPEPATGRGEQITPGTPEPLPRSARTSPVSSRTPTIRPGQAYPTPPPAPTPPPSRRPAARSTNRPAPGGPTRPPRIESVDTVVIKTMSPIAEKDISTLLSEVEAVAATAPSKPADDLVSMVRDIRDLLVKLAGEPEGGGDVTNIPTDPVPEPVIPEDAERVENAN